jgi:hypothetical protein
VSTTSIAYTSPYGPVGPRGDIINGQSANIVVKLPVADQVWYLVVVPATGIAGWVNSTAIALPPVDVNRITPVSDAAPLAVVFNGGNIRRDPLVADNVIGTAEAGQNVTLTGRLGDNSWFRIQGPTGTGWVSAGLLTIKPENIPQVPITP